ncbi:MAG: chemotaxis protein CheD, partial [Fimbriimonadales bacterium]|nr:chemotaxis protein CheD [Fimbriimonadales bacterium]
MLQLVKAEVLFAGMGEIKTARGDGILGCIGLGSCVGALIYDPATATAALAHVMLPEPNGAELIDMPGKYATTALPALLETLGLPSAPSRLKALLIGGAEVFQNRQNALRIGARNVEKLHSLLQARRIPVVFEDTGGQAGRSFEFE